MTAVPELDLARIQRYCDGRVPSHLHDKIRIELEVHYLAARGVWLLDWRDRNLRWHRYDLIKPSAHVEPLLAEIEADPTSIFWG